MFHNFKKHIILHLTWQKTYMIPNRVLYVLTYCLSRVHKKQLFILQWVQTPPMWACLTCAVELLKVVY